MQQLIEFAMNHWILVSILLVLLGLILYTELTGISSNLRLLSPQQLVIFMNQQTPIVVDVRLPEEYKKGHILGALNFPLEDFSTHLKKISGNRDKAAVIYGFDPSKLNPAIKALRQEGFKELLGIKGGIQQWQVEGLPLTKNAPTSKTTTT